MKKPACNTCYKYKGLEGYGPFILRGECEDLPGEHKPFDFCPKHPKWQTWCKLQVRYEMLDKLPRLERYTEDLNGQTITFASDKNWTWLYKGQSSEVVEGVGDQVKVSSHICFFDIKDFVIEEKNRR